MIVWRTCFFETNESNISFLTETSTPRPQNQIQTLKILNQNVCGLTSKRDDFEIYLNTFGDYMPHFLCLSEHFLTQSNVGLFSLNYYNLCTYNVRRKKKRGGALILGLKGRSTEEIKLCKKLYVSDSFEICGIGILTQI